MGYCADLADLAYARPGQYARPIILICFAEAKAAVMSILVDNFDHKSKDPKVQEQLAMAKEWEKSFVEFMHRYPKENNVSHLFDLAFNSERSIEDELERETSGDIPTIAVSYALMVVYIIFALGRLSR